MRIVTLLISLGVGGAERQALAVAERMAKRGHAVEVLVLRPLLPEEWRTTLPTIHLDMRKSPVSFLLGILRARRFLREFKPDVVHSHSFHANIFARLLKMAAPSLRVVSTVHNVYEGGRLRMLAYRLTDPLSRRTVAVSQAAWERFVRLKAIPARKSLVVQNGIDLAEFAPGAERRAAMRSAMNAGERFVWFTAGRLVPAKDFPNLIEAFRQVLTEFPETELWIAGAPPDAKVIRHADGKASFVWLTAMASEMRDRVRWLGLRRDVPALLDAADAFVLGFSVGRDAAGRWRSHGHGKAGGGNRRRRCARARWRRRLADSGKESRGAHRSDGRHDAQEQERAGAAWARGAESDTGAIQPGCNR